MIKLCNNFGNTCALGQAMHPCPKGVILACGVSRKININPGDPDKCHDAGSVQVDTTCLCKPLVKIDFCANIRYKDWVGSTWCNKAKLKFYLKRVCNGNVDLLEEFVYSREFDLCGEQGELTTQDSFCFTYCDRPFSGPCTYKVIVKDDIGGNVNEICIENTQINAIAQAQG